MTEQQPFEPLGLPPQPDAPPPVDSRPDGNEAFWSYSDVLIFAGLAIPCLLLGVGFVKTLEFLFRFHPKIRMVELLPAQFLGYALLFTALWLLFKWQYGRPFWRSLAWNALRMPPLLVVLAGLATAFGVSAVSLLLQTPNTSNPMTEMLEDPTSLALVALFGITLGPLFEELFFRGFLQPLLVRSMGVPAGILVAAVPFGLLHFQEYGNSWRHVVLISLAGAAFGVMRQVTRSTKASTVMHGSYNALFFIALLVQRNQGRL
ncbi:MAG TPA: CPBP family intramembrane glutamic endopeptidase [Bryobacteraceae bacterium]|nr:CPBP family intramembrane glutamic endopeptidase [Bryobacteraceae bacterium]